MKELMLNALWNMRKHSCNQFIKALQSIGADKRTPLELNIQDILFMPWREEPSPDGTKVLSTEDGCVMVLVQLGDGTYGVRRLERL